MCRSPAERAETLNNHHPSWPLTSFFSFYFLFNISSYSYSSSSPSLSIFTTVYDFNCETKEYTFTFSLMKQSLVQWWLTVHRQRERPTRSGSQEPGSSKLLYCWLCRRGSTKKYWPAGYCIETSISFYHSLPRLSLPPSNYLPRECIE